MSIIFLIMHSLTGEGIDKYVCVVVFNYLLVGFAASGHAVCSVLTQACAVAVSFRGKRNVLSTDLPGHIGGREL